MSFIVTPPFPDYVSGHSTFSAAAATVLPLFYDTEDLPFTVGSDFLPGVYRSFSTCFAAAEEAAASRIYGGIHFRSASEDGLQAGTSIGDWTATRYLLPKHNRRR
jgi:membrane-associated phospholipid phosphatase